jgi:phenylpyruvate tautomerase PptA (4-oxalocrotonate tautomerase family)
MPLIDITAPAGAFSPTAAEAVQHKVAQAVMAWMGLPDTDFFAGATWVYLHEAGQGRSATGAPGTAPGFLVVVTALEKFLTPERNESLAADITRIIREEARYGADDETPVWTVVHEIPEGYWAVNAGLTRRAKLDVLLAQAAQG